MGRVPILLVCFLTTLDADKSDDESDDLEVFTTFQIV